MKRTDRKGDEAVRIVLATSMKTGKPPVDRSLEPGYIEDVWSAVCAASPGDLRKLNGKLDEAAMREAASSKPLALRKATFLRTFNAIAAPAGEVVKPVAVSGKGPKDLRAALEALGLSDGVKPAKVGRFRVRGTGSRFGMLKVFAVATRKDDDETHDTA